MGSDRAGDAISRLLIGDLDLAGVDIVIEPILHMTKRTITHVATEPNYLVHKEVQLQRTSEHIRCTCSNKCIRQRVLGAHAMSMYERATSSCPCWRNIL